jgi:hypothetical protein
MTKKSEWQEFAEAVRKAKMGDDVNTDEYFVHSAGHFITDAIEELPYEWKLQLFTMIWRLRTKNLYDETYQEELFKTCQTVSYYLTRAMLHKADGKLEHIKWPEVPAYWNGVEK